MKFFPSILDRYITRQFVGGFIFALLLIISVAVTIDFGERAKFFVRHNLSAGEVLSGYYLYFLPYMLGLMGQYFVLITVIYFTSRMTNRSEIIAMFNSGMSFGRLLVPYIVTSSILAALMWYAMNYIIPETDSKRLVFEAKYFAPDKSSSDANIHVRLNDSMYYYFRIYDHPQRTAFNVSLEHLKDNHLVEKTIAEKAIFDTLVQRWNFINYFTRKIDPITQKETIVKGEKLPTHFFYDATVLLKRWTHKQELNRSELWNQIETLKQQGSNNYKFYEIEYHTRTAKCIGIIILTIIGVILSSKKIRGGLGLHLMAGIALGAVYEVIYKFTSTLAEKADFSPFFASWTPNFIYIIIAILLWRYIQK